MQILPRELLELLTELQTLESLKSFSLAGGTNLAIRYGHRESNDLDLFSNQVVGKQGLNNIEGELRDFFKDRIVFLNIENPGAGEQFCFIRSFIRKGPLTIKVEILQNIQILYPVELTGEFRLISIMDIGTMKLQSLSSRKAKKDVYDLDRITDDIPLPDLIELLKGKEQRFQDERYKCLFDLDENSSPTKDPLLLLAFDKINYETIDGRPSHSNDILKIANGGKKWVVARSHWKKKVSQHCMNKGIVVPKAGPIN